MLEQPPWPFLSLSRAIADVGGWFDWNALEAIGTVGALWFAVDQAGKSARAERTRAVGVLTALIGLVEPVSDHLPPLEPGEGDRLSADQVGWLQEGKPIIQHAIDGIRAFSVTDIAAVGATEYFGVTKIALADAHDLVPQHLGDKVNTYQWNLALETISEAVEFYRQRRDYIQYGRVWRWVRAEHHKLQMKFRKAKLRRTLKAGTASSESRSEPLHPPGQHND